MGSEDRRAVGISGREGVEQDRWRRETIADGGIRDGNGSETKDICPADIDSSSLLDNSKLRTRRCCPDCNVAYRLPRSSSLGPRGRMSV